jgi:hypothetical protein
VPRRPPLLTTRAIATLLIATAAVVVAAAAAATGAAHWPAGAVIRVWVDPVGAPPGGDVLVERAMKTWTDAARGRFRLERAGRKDGAVVRVHFFTRDWRYGMTQARPDPQTGLLTGAEVVVAADADGDALDHRIVIYLTALHELGHALGMSHSADINDIMYLFRLEGDGERFFGAYRKRLRSADDIGSALATGLSAEDVRVLRSLYD